MPKQGHFVAKASRNFGWLRANMNGLMKRMHVCSQFANRLECVLLVLEGICGYAQRVTKPGMRLPVPLAWVVNSGPEVQCEKRIEVVQQLPVSEFFSVFHRTIFRQR